MSESKSDSPASEDAPSDPPKDSDAKPDESLGALAGRSAIGGILMGLANLVPGISGGTMLLASGVYLRFIEAIAEVSRLKFRKTSLLVLGVIVVAALVSIVLFAGPVKNLVVNYRWIMYSLFIGLTLGGVPLVWKMAKPATGGTWAGAAIGFGVLAALAFLTPGGAAGDGGFLLMFVAGVAGASAMILPGVSGGYLLVLMGAYVPILTGIDAFKEALKARSMDALMGPLMDVVLPVGLGVGIGVLVVSNGLEWVLKRYEKPTLGVLLGFLVGSVVGLWPFQQGVAPSIGDTFKGQTVTAELLAELAPEKYPTEFFTPSAVQIAGALALVVVGAAITVVIARFGAAKSEMKKTQAAADA